MPGPRTSATIASASWANGVETVTLSAAPSTPFLVDQVAAIFYGNGNAANGNFPILSVPSSTTITYALASNPGTITPANNPNVQVPTPPPSGGFSAGTVFGGWQFVDNQYCGYVAICQGGVTNATPFPVQGGLLVTSNQFANVASETNVDTTSTTSGFTFRTNYDYMQMAVSGAFSQSNLGIGYPHPGFQIVNMDSNPNDAAYGLVGPVKPEATSAVPSSGTWAKGDYVRNFAPTASTPTAGWLRVTDGTGNTLGTAWIAK